MVWWPLSDFSFISVILCGLWSLSLITINLFLSVSSVVSGLSLVSQWSQGLRSLWWSSYVVVFLCGGVVLLITGLSNSCGVSGNSVFGFYVEGVEMA